MHVEWMILAEAAEVVNNKLYLMGAGWDTVTVNGSLPLLHHMAVAVDFRVPWPETNDRHHVGIEVVRSDSERIFRLDGVVEIGPPPGVPLEDAAHARMAVSFLLELKELGTYSVVARIEEREAAHLPLRVLAGPTFSATGNVVGPTSSL